MEKTLAEMYFEENWFTDRLKDTSDILTGKSWEREKEIYHQKD